nr:hypothetical protein [Tanacetum cinerariifolium]
MAEDDKLKIKNIMVMISVSVRCKSKTLYIRRSFRSLWQKPNLQSLKPVACRGKEVNIEAGDSDDIWVCCVKNTVEDHIMDSGVGDVVLKNSFSTSWTLKDVRIDMSMLASKGNVPDVHKVDIYFCKPGSCYYDTVIEDCSRSYTRSNANLQFGVAERLSRTFRAESTRLRAEALKMLWADSDTSLTHMKVFGCDPFVKVKDVCGEAMKCTFKGSDSDEMRYSF